MVFHVSRADCAGRAGNCSYPHWLAIRTGEELREAAAFDHVCGEFKGGYRSIGNYLRSDVIVMDIDNDHSEAPEEWITVERLAEVFADVSYMVATSRHNMLPKGSRGARPRLHVYYPIEECTDAERYARLKRALAGEYGFFDDNALDAARFIYGAQCEEVTVHEGWLTIDEVVRPLEAAGTRQNQTGRSGADVRAGGADGRIGGAGARMGGADDRAGGAGTGTGGAGGQRRSEAPHSGVIEEGSRNSTMSRFASRILKRYGNTEKAHVVFLEHAERCEPPLSEAELATIWGSAVRFYTRRISKADGYVAPDAYNADFSDESLQPEDYSDIGEARVLVREYGGELRYSAATDYLRYDGERWVEDLQLAIGAIEEFLDLQLADAEQAIEVAGKALMDAGVPEAAVRAGSKVVAKEELTDAQMPLLFALMGAETYLRFVMRRRDYKYIISTGNAAKPMLGIDVNDLDRNELLLNTPVATYDLRKGLAGEQPHDPEDLITKMTTCGPGEEGRQLWLDALALFFCGDQELIDYVQLVVGMAAIGKVYQEHMIIAYGGGANGKSTFWNTIFRVMGDYAGKLSAEALTMNCKRNIKPEMAELKGRRLIISSEMEEGMRLNTATVKQLCSTDEIQAEKKYKAPFHFVPSHTLVLYTNHLPRVGANDDGIWRRLIVIPFNARIVGANDIKNYADYLYEHAGSYIMTWIIEGAQRAIEREFKVPLPQVVEEAIAAYREENDWLGHFLADCCDVSDAKATTGSGALYQAYRAYSINQGEYTRSTTDFYAALEKAGHRRQKRREGVLVYGVRLLEGQEFLA